MSAIEDVLSKPEWPPIADHQHDIIINLLVNLCARGSSDEFAVGFNDSMRALETKKVKALFVARSDLSAAECMPLALASASHNIPLIALRKGALERLGTGVAALVDGNEALLRAVDGIPSAKIDWLFNGATLRKLKK